MASVSATNVAASEGEKLAIRDCPVCYGTETSNLYRQSFQALSGVSLFDGYSIVICNICGVGYAGDIPAQSSFDAYYRDFSKYEVADKPYDAGFKPDKLYYDAASTVEPFIPGKESRILDVGCASAHLLHVLEERGYRNVVGVDPSPACCRFAQNQYGITVHLGTVFESEVPENQFDFVLLVGVIEHIRDLDRAVNHIRKLVANDGLVYIEVPDATRFSPEIDAPFQQFSIEHINYFSMKTLSNLMTMRGFACVSTGQALRAYKDIVEPAAYAVFKKTDAQPAFERDEQSQKELQRYISESRTEDQRIRLIIRSAVQNDRKIMVWGVGTHTQRLLATGGLDPKDIRFFIDSSVKYSDQNILGVPIIGPHDLEKYSEPILISSRGFQTEIAKKIREELHLSNELVTLYEAVK